MAYNIIMDAHHAYCKELTKHWDAIPEILPEHYLDYGIYQYLILDYLEAEKWFLQALKNGQVTAAYYLGFFAEKGLGNEKDPKTASSYFTLYMDAMKDNFDLIEDSMDAYRIGMCLGYGWGIDQNDALAGTFFEKSGSENGEALYQLGKGYEYGCFGKEKNAKQALEYYWQAFQKMCGKALWAHFRLSGETLENYPHALILKTWYSYRVGCYMRVVKENPSYDACMRLAKCYLDGYPGDSPEGMERSYKKYELYTKEALKYN